jgi:hypothetical protein
VIELAVNMGQFLYFYINIWKKGTERRVFLYPYLEERNGTDIGRERDKVRKTILSTERNRWLNLQRLP